MKTALQEFIDNVIPMHIIELDMIKQEIKKGLEKEKEQLLDFGLYVKKNGWVGCKIEDLYEDYYNQKK